MRQSDTTGTLTNVVRRHFRLKQGTTLKLHFPQDVAAQDEDRPDGHL